MHKYLSYNKFIMYLYMFRALCARHQEVKIVLSYIQIVPQYHPHTHSYPTSKSSLGTTHTHSYPTSKSSPGTTHTHSYPTSKSSPATTHSYPTSKSSPVPPTQTPLSYIQIIPQYHPNTHSYRTSKSSPATTHSYSYPTYSISSYL